MIKLNRLGHKEKESPYLNKVIRVLRNDYNPANREVLQMKGSWENNPIPLYGIICLTDKYGNLPGYRLADVERASKDFALTGADERSDLFYEKLLGYLLKGYEKYSRNSFPNLRKLDASLSSKEIEDSVEYISKAIMLHPHFEGYLEKVSPLLNTELQSAIKKAREDEFTIYSKYASYKNAFHIDSYGNIHKEKKISKNLYGSLSSLSDVEKCLVSFFNDAYDEKKLSEKSVNLANDVLLNLINLRPDVATTMVSPRIYLESSLTAVRKKYIDVLLDEKLDLLSNGSAVMWKSNGYFGLHSQINGSVRAIVSNEDYASEGIAKLLLAVKEFEPKKLVYVYDVIKSNYAAISRVEDITKKLYELNNNTFDKEFINFYKNTKFFKNKLKSVDVKGVPNHLKVDAFFKPNASIEELLKENVKAVKVNDINREMASSSEFWVSYINNFKTNVNYSKEIARKMKSSSDSKEVLDALIASKEPVSAAYLLTVNFKDFSEEDRQNAIYNKTLENPETVLFIPPELRNKLNADTINESVRGLRDLLRDDKAYEVMLCSPDFIEREKQLRKELVNSFVEIIDNETQSPKRKLR